MRGTNDQLPKTHPINRDTYNVSLIVKCLLQIRQDDKPIEPEPPEIQHKIREGSRVYIQTKDGRELTLKVSQVTAETIIGIEISLTEVEAIPFD